MSGRNGNDAVGMTVFFISFGLAIANIFVTSNYLLIAEAVFIFYFLFRIMSRNVYQRRRENAAYLGFFHKIKIFFATRIKHFKERKIYVYKKCPSCKKTLRLKHEKGKHIVVCPNCRNEFKVKI